MGSSSGGGGNDGITIKAWKNVEDVFGKEGIFGNKGGLAAGKNDVVGKAIDNARGVNKTGGNYDPVDVEKMYKEQGGYNSPTDISGHLYKNYKTDDPAALNSRLDSSGLDALKARATATGPSTWANMATQKQAHDENNQLGLSARAGMGQQATARSSLAMHGGLRGGSAERLAAAGAESNALAGQDIRSQGASNRLDIGMQDQAQKNQFLSQLPGAQLAAAGYSSGLDQQNVSNKMGNNQFNVGNSIAALGGKNSYTQNMVGQKIAATGAAQGASALENAGKK